jgi:hypothetical protein
LKRAYGDGERVESGAIGTCNSLTRDGRVNPSRRGRGRTLQKLAGGMNRVKMEEIAKIRLEPKYAG